MDFESRNSKFATYNIMQYSLRPKDEICYEFNDFYKYVIGAQIPRGQGASVADLSFVYEERNTYGIMVQHLIYDDILPGDASHSDISPGIVVNEILGDLETKITLEYLEMCQPVPHLSPRSEFKRTRDLQFLSSIGLEEWRPSFGDSSLGYFFSMDELRRNPGLIEVNSRRRYE